MILKKASSVKILKSVIPNIKHDPKIIFIFCFFIHMKYNDSIIISKIVTPKFINNCVGLNIANNIAISPRDCKIVCVRMNDSLNLFL